MGDGARACVHDAAVQRGRRRSVVGFMKSHATRKARANHEIVRNGEGALEAGCSVR